MGTRSSRTVPLDEQCRPLDEMSLRAMMDRCSKISRKLSLRRYIDIRVSIKKAKNSGYYSKWLAEYESSGVRKGTWYALLAIKLTHVSRSFQIGPKLTEKELIDYIRVRHYKSKIESVIW